ncbi:DUF3093 domain-containing protein [Rugosimonospora africana]|uniref:DUF3093 domain-containing protein n=1 Tax=Rugosimonospora africana TaxID=556532 RepID=A0A8J3QMQ6_9ACTN|nr:DUF3093 domain-containing protein [Rugosimonospora africana]GIH13784.1 hypothetical protein Raf01_19560 [Rugosimonospora africana]
MAQHPNQTPAASGTGEGDDAVQRPDDHRSVSAARYAERLIVPWWLWLIALALAAMLSAEVYLGAPGLATWVPYLILLPLTVLGLAAAGRIRVAVEGGELRVDDARLPVRFVSEVGVLDAAARREALGPNADRYAFVVQRPWVPRAVLVVLNDPEDPTPYWVISARRPERVAKALLAARAAGLSPEPGAGSATA